MKASTYFGRRSIIMTVHTAQTSTSHFTAHQATIAGAATIAEAASGEVVDPSVARKVLHQVLESGTNKEGQTKTRTNDIQPVV